MTSARKYRKNNVYDLRFLFHEQRLLINTQKISSFLHLPPRINDCWMANRDAAFVCHFIWGIHALSTWSIIFHRICIWMLFCQWIKDEIHFLFRIEKNGNCNNRIIPSVLISLKIASCLFYNLKLHISHSFFLFFFSSDTTIQIRFLLFQ